MTFPCSNDVKQCSVEETLTRPLFFVRYGYVFQHRESWHKIGCCHFGSSLPLCFSFDFPPFCLIPTLFDFSGPFFQVSQYFILLSSTRWATGETMTNILWLALQRIPLLIQFLLYFSQHLNSSSTWLSHPSNSPAWLTSAPFFRIPIPFALGSEAILWRHLSGRITSCNGPLRTQNHHLRSQSKNSCYVLWSSLHKECWPCCYQEVLKRATESTRTGVDIGEFVDLCSMILWAESLKPRTNLTL